MLSVAVGVEPARRMTSFRSTYVSAKSLIDAPPRSLTHERAPGIAGVAQLEHYPINLDHSLLWRAANLETIGAASAAKLARSLSFANERRLSR